MKKTLIVFGLIISLAFSLDKPTLREVQTAIDDMLLPTTQNFTYKILSVSAPVKNFVAVAIDPPYREFPNIVLFTYVENKWQRVFETLSVGVQVERSAFVDLHTKGLGVDFMLGKQTEYSFQDPTVRKLIEQDSIIIPYKNFIHMHLAGSSKYVIDKTGLYDLANQLFTGDYAQYPTTNCMAYDLSRITSTEFTAVGNTYTVTAKTDNGQLWQVSFEGLEEDRQYLKNKKIVVQKL
jgi:hypothetical protein